MRLYRAVTGYFSRNDILIWSISMLSVMIAFCLFDRVHYMILINSLIGVTYLIFNAKGNPIGQVLVIIFSLLNGLISYSFSYYGEMITYLGMTMPMAVFALIAWLKMKERQAEETENTVQREHGSHP